jgi:hypothetical protein
MTDDKRHSLLAFLEAFEKAQPIFELIVGTQCVRVALDRCQLLNLA